VLIIDQHALVRTGLRLVVESQPNMIVVGEAGSTADALGIAAQEQPEIILLEPHFRGHVKLDLVSKLIAAAENARVILVTWQGEQDTFQQAIEAGAVGIVSKDQSADTLVKAIVKVQAGELWLSHNLIATILKHSHAHRHGKGTPTANGIASLSHRQLEVIALMGQGLKNKQIAERLSITETTVRHHLTAIFAKLGLSDRMELMIYAYRHGLAKLPP
jgi:two-component system nitrate/nitrite response regulator NarL